MTRSSVVFTQTCGAFWNKVQKAEQDIRENGHVGRLPPICFGDPWDAEFAQAYDAVRPHLSKFRKERYYRVPSGLAFRPSPLKAETAHQALMFFLNRPDELYGEKGVLDSPEYKAIKEAAMLELQQRDEIRISKNRRPSSSSSAKQRSSIIELRAFLIDHHFPKGRPFQKETLPCEAIEQEFGWSQGTVSKKMTTLFKLAGGMTAYTALFEDKETSTPKGFRKLFDDSTLDVDSLWIDRRSDDDAESDDEDESE